MADRLTLRLDGLPPVRHRAPEFLDLPERTTKPRRAGITHVLDRGIGIADDDAGSVFTPFYRTDEARLKASGMGVGLAVCKRIVEAQGGRVWAGPRDGGGADVGFALPLSSDREEGSASG